MPSLREAMFRIKTDDPEENKVELNRCLKLTDLIAIGAGATLGAGVYMLSGEVAVNKAGPAVTLCFAIAAVASILSGICYAELGCRVPKSGSGYAYLYATLGEAPAFAIGWCLLISYMVASSSVASAFTVYLNDLTGNYVKDNFFWPKLGVSGMREAFDWPSVIIIILLGILMCVGVEEVSKLTNCLLLINIATICVIILLCCFGIDFSNWTQDTGVSGKDLPRFFDTYYKNTTMVKDDVSDGNSFIDKHCMRPAYSQAWSGEEPKHKWKMTCELMADKNDKIFAETKKVEGVDVTQYFVDIKTNYGNRRYAVEKESDNKTGSVSNILVIEDSAPGAGGYTPFGWAGGEPGASTGVMAGAATCFYGFIGFDAIATTGEEAINPQENIPKAITYALAIICAIYLAISGLLTLNFPYYAMNPQNPFAAAMAWNGYAWVVNPIRIGAIAALIASLIGGMLPMPRILFNMANDGLVYKVFGSINEKTKVPQNATIFCTIIAAIMAAIFDLDVLVDFLSIGTLAAYTIVAICVLILRYRPDEVEAQKGVPSEAQGIRARNLTLTLTCIHLFGFLFIEKILPVIMEEGPDKDKVWKGILGAIALYTVYPTYVMATMEESQTEVAFKTPMLPYFPVLSIAINCWLMAALNTPIWYKLAIWLFLGFVVYFTYGIKNSTEANKYKPRDDQEMQKLNEAKA